LPNILGTYTEQVVQAQENDMLSQGNPRRFLAIENQ
jgi:hypothetical protein